MIFLTILAAWRTVAGAVTGSDMIGKSDPGVLIGTAAFSEKNPEKKDIVILDFKSLTLDKGCILRRRAPDIYQLRRSWFQKPYGASSVAGN